MRRSFIGKHEGIPTPDFNDAQLAYWNAHNSFPPMFASTDTPPHVIDDAIASRIRRIESERDQELAVKLHHEIEYLRDFQVVAEA